MKKAIVLALALVLTLSLSIPAAAARTGSPVAPNTSDTTTAPLPEVVETEITTDDGTKLIIDPIAADDTENLSEEVQEVLATAQKALKAATPKGMKAQYFFYVQIDKVEADGATTKYDGSVDMIVKIENITEVVVKQFIDGKWVELEAIINDDGTITIKGVVEGPIAIFTK